MLRTASIRTWLCVTATLALAATADASPLVRTFISNGGNDANAASGGCVVTAPCRTLTTAYADTISGGEIVMMNAAGYGCVTITGPLSIIGTFGATSTATSGACIVINAGSTDKIVIRDLEITGANVSGTIGIQLNSGLLSVINSGFKMLGTGMLIGNGSSTAHADVVHSDFIGNTTAIETNGAGVPWNSGVGEYLTQGGCPCQTLVRINGGNYINNATTFLENNPTATAGQPSAAFWAVGQYATGYTTLETSMGTGSTAGQPNLQTSTPFPN